MLSMTACGGAAETAEVASAEQENQVIIAYASDTDSLDPANVYETYTRLIFSGMYETLFKFEDESSAATPFLVDAYEVSEDGLTVSMTLKEGITFASGNPMTAEDVAFSIIRVINMKGNPSSLIDTVENVEAIDELTVEFTLTQPDSALTAKLCYASFAITDSAVVIENGGVCTEDAALEDEASAYLNENSAGSGPYVMESYQANVETVLVKNENYWGEEAKLDKIILKDIPDANTQRMMLVSGDADIAFNLNADTVTQLVGNEELEIITAPTKTMAFLFMNMDEELGGPVADPLVQEAIRYALDYDGYKYIIGEGTVTPLSFIQVGFLGCLGEREEGFRDLEKAKELLAQAGYPDGFTIDFPVTDLIPEGIALTDLAQKIKSDLAEVGITLEIEPSTWAGGYGDQYRNGEIGFSVMYWSPDYNDPVVQLKFLPGQMVGERVNWAAGSEPELEALYSEILATTDEENKVALLEQVQEYTSEFGPYIPIAQYPTNVVIDANLKGVEFSNIYRTDLVNLTW